MTYSEKLKDPRWLKLRKKIISLAGKRCEDCRIDQTLLQKPLEVHHCLYLGDCEPWEYSPKVLIAVCPDCHERRQRIEKSLRMEMARLNRLSSIREIEERYLETTREVEQREGRKP